MTAMHGIKIAAQICFKITFNMKSRKKKLQEICRLVQALLISTNSYATPYLISKDKKLQKQGPSYIKPTKWLLASPSTHPWTNKLKTRTTQHHLRAHGGSVNLLTTTPHIHANCPSCSPHAQLPYATKSRPAKMSPNYPQAPHHLPTLRHMHPAFHPGHREAVVRSLKKKLGEDPQVCHTNVAYDSYSQCKTLVTLKREGKKVVVKGRFSTTPFPFPFAPVNVYYYQQDNLHTCQVI